MTKFIDIAFLAENISAKVEMLEAAAPRTCKTIWECLPIEELSHHGAYSGTIVAVHFDPTVVIAEENATTYVQTGDVMYTHYAAGVRHGHPDALSEIYWAYDRYARPTIPGQGVPATANVFGRIVGDATAFYEACRTSRYHRSTLRLRKAAAPGVETSGGSDVS
jgi:hypothetical protein